MNLSPKYIVAFTLMVFAMFGWNLFLTVRDAKLFRNMETIKENYCAHQAPKNHPDCVLE